MVPWSAVCACGISRSYSLAFLDGLYKKDYIGSVVMKKQVVMKKASGYEEASGYAQKMPQKQIANKHMTVRGMTQNIKTALNAMQSNQLILPQQNDYKTGKTLRTTPQNNDPTQNSTLNQQSGKSCIIRESSPGCT